MARTSPAGRPATPDAAQPRFWRWTGEYDLYVAASGLRVRPRDVVAGDTPPTANPLWVADDGPATATRDRQPGPRTWTPAELQRGALREDWADAVPASTDDQPTEVDQ